MRQASSGPGGSGDDGRLEVTGATPEQVAKAAAALAIPVFECVAAPAQLEDIFLQLTATKDTQEVAR